MTYTFRPASRGSAKLLVGLYAESGCGKTRSALEMARGFAGPAGVIAMIDTEAGRGEAYADIIPGGYVVLALTDPFSPASYGDAIKAAEQLKPAVLIIDSASHEWEGAGGVLSMAAKNQEAGKKGPIVWQVPKLEHQRQFMLRLMATPIPLVVVCMRAKYPMKEQRKADGGKEWVRSTELEPKQSEDILFEMFVHGWIDRTHKFHGTKYTRDDLAQVIRDGEMITQETGRRLADWAKGGSLTTDRPPASTPAGTTADIFGDTMSRENVQKEARRIKADVVAAKDDLDIDMILSRENVTLERIKAASVPAYEHVMGAATQKRTDLLAAA